MIVKKLTWRKIFENTESVTLDIDPDTWDNFLERNGYVLTNMIKELGISEKNWKKLKSKIGKYKVAKVIRHELGIIENLGALPDTITLPSIYGEEWIECVWHFLKPKDGKLIVVHEELHLDLELCEFNHTLTAYQLVETKEEEIT